jgi:hypothetical protein
MTKTRADGDGQELRNGSVFQTLPGSGLAGFGLEMLLRRAVLLFATNPPLVLAAVCVLGVCAIVVYVYLWSTQQGAVLPTNTFF